MSSVITGLAAIADVAPADNRPTLYIRRPGSDAEEIHQFHDDDPFLTEMSNFTDALITESKLDIGKPLSAAPQILSSYEDGESEPGVVAIWC